MHAYQANVKMKPSWLSQMGMGLPGEEDRARPSFFQGLKLVELRPPTIP